MERKGPHPTQASLLELAGEGCSLSAGTDLSSELIHSFRELVLRTGRRRKVALPSINMQAQVMVLNGESDPSDTSQCRNSQLEPRGTSGICDQALESH